MVAVITGMTGTVSEIEWAELMGLGTQKYTRDAVPTVTLLPSESAPTAIRLNPFRSFGAGVMVKDTQNTNMAVPSGAVVGRWYLLVLRRTWGVTPSAQHVWIASTGSGANPPSTFPAGRIVNPGVQDDEPVLWWKHYTTGGSLVSNIVPITNLAAGAVVNTLSLWNGTEQGIMNARVIGGTAGDPNEQWRFGASEKYAWNVAQARWEPRGSDTITIYREFPGIVSGGSTVPLDVDITGLFEYPPFVTAYSTAANPVGDSISTSASLTSARVNYSRTNTSSVTVRVLIEGVPKRI